MQRREFLAATAALPIVSALPGMAGAGPFSGLPWKSGCSLSKFADFERWRGRRLDTVTVWTQRRTWSELVGQGGGFTVVDDKPMQISQGFAIFPDTHPRQWKLAAAGSFDGYYTQYAQKLANSGRKDMIVRVGWETNDPGPCYGGDDPVNFVATFRRIVDILRKHNPTITTEWNNLKDGKGGSVLDMYPGDGWVDIIGVNFYDNWPALNTEEIWAAQYNRTRYGGPRGIGAWLSFAKSRGKKFSCSEWGISVGSSPGATDNPLYIRKMFEFFSTNAAHIAYENYFNQRAKHQIYPGDVNPKASAEYKRLWGA